MLLDSPIPGSNKSETQLAICEHTATISTLLSKGKTVDLFPLIFSCPGIGGEAGEAGEDRTIYVNRCMLSLFALWRIDRLSCGLWVVWWGFSIGNLYNSTHPDGL